MDRIALILSTFAVRYAPLIHDKVQSLPQYQTVSKIIDAKDFTKLELHGVDSIKLVQSKDFSVQEQGRQIDIDRTQFEVQDGTLVLTQKSRGKVCFFCFGRDQVAITISMPNVSEIRAGGLTEIKSDSVTATGMLKIDLSGNSSLTINKLSAENVQTEVSGISLAHISGSADTLDLHVSGASVFSGQDFKVKTAAANVSGDSHVEVSVSQKLTGNASGVSSITYSGLITAEVHTSGNSEVIHSSPQ
jgi:hypothetical protein